GWYRVSAAVADYLRTVRQRGFDDTTPPAFDVCTEEEAQALQARELDEARLRQSPTDSIPLSVARSEGGVMTTSDLAKRARLPRASEPPRDDAPKEESRAEAPPKAETPKPEA